MISDIRREFPPSEYPYVSGHSRASLVVVCLWLTIAARTLCMANAILSIQYVQQAADGMEYSDNETALYHLSVNALDGLVIAVQVATAIAFLMWIYRAHSNLPALGAINLEYSPGWAVGCFFIPVANLIWPYFAMSEIWRGSDPTKYNTVSGRCLRSFPLLVACWWGLCLLMIFMNPGSSQVSRIPGTHETLIHTHYLSVVAYLVAAISAIVAVKLVRTIDENQEERHTLTLRPPVKTTTSIPGGFDFFNLDIECSDDKNA